MHTWKLCLLGKQEYTVEVCKHNAVKIADCVLSLNLLMDHKELSKYLFIWNVLNKSISTKSCKEQK